MRNAVVCVLLLVASSSPASAAFTDFSDYSASRTFATGESFQSQGITFKAIELTSSSSVGPTLIVASPSPSFAKLVPGRGVEFVLPAAVQEVSFEYDDGAGLLLVLNGIQPPRPGENGTPYHAGFSFLNGMSVAGVDVTTTTTTSTTSFERGVVTFRGPINSVAFAGLELLIDNVNVIVPEPNAAAMLVAGAVGTSRLRRRRRS